MSTSTAGCKQMAPSAQEKTCLPCDIPASCRNSYYRGKLLTERDFNDEQRYGIDKRRLHTLALHGWGVVCGLVVRPHPHCPEKRLVVGEGLAIDDSGREIRLLQEDCVTLPKPVPMSSQPVAGQAASPASLGSVANENPLEDAEDDREPTADDRSCDPTPVPKDLYLCIRYAECETEFAPAPFDDCSCTTSSQKPNRICESYELVLSEQKPTFWDKATREPCELGDCDLYYRNARECCPPTNCFPCLPLAVICNFVPGEAIKPEQIDNWRSRRLLASTETLDEVIRCILTKLPTGELTRIEDTNWEHNRRMMCREFMEEYIGTLDHPRGFRIEFSHKVHSGSIDDRSFQALVVFHPDNESEPRHMQIAPARVEREPDETTFARLHINYDYARRHLDGRSFDLFLILKCDVIRDEHDHAVDGNFIAHRLPTGDNIQGGTFESWVRVRPKSGTN
jgi:hypothetical protein